ncbi:lysylphosphatidylglycerol synthase transmembrane domain-containing protein [Actinacidiphila soli]|uniref:lysylphosphatidylglycerol synthase transmembrane domain-containing protein n=1 Tax=Actinacidiphila soli TaxID=2487275 RepID=UPI002245D1BB|nr:lysylphosphatidylglycerol synthase transmembrane domain-containing protein [Actinacidiphila soli]
MTRRIWPWLRLLIGAGILAALVWRMGATAFVGGLRVIDGGSILAALAIGLLTTVFSAWRWCLVARRLGLRLPLAKAVSDYYRALLLNAVLPAGVLGDVDRAVRHGRRTGDVGRGVRAVFLERAGGQVVVLALGAAVLLTRPALVSSMAGHFLPSGAVLAVVLSALAVLVLLGAWALRRRGASRGRRAFAAGLADVRKGLLARGTWPGVVLLSAAGLVGHVALFLVAARVAGSPAPLAALVPPTVLALLVMGLPVNIGGWGPREAASTLAFGAAGLGATQGLATAVVYGVLTLVASLPGVVVLALPGIRAFADKCRWPASSSGTGSGTMASQWYRASASEQGSQDGVGA